jgi:C4-type Zn-finger protein
LDYFIEITTVEGVLQKTKSALINDQQIRQRCDPINAAKIDTFIAKLDDLMQLKQRFTLV